MGQIMDFNKKLEMYANLLIIHGLNVQPGQIVNITCECIHSPLAEKMTRAAYRCGAKFVHVDFVDPKLSRIRIEESKSDDYFKYVPPYIPVKYNDFVDEHAAVIRIVGSEDPHILEDLPPQKVNDIQKYLRQSLKRYYEEGIGKSKVQWNVAAAATPAWGKQVFPELSPEEANDALWEAIFKICHADQEDCLKIWQKKAQDIEHRSKILNDLKIETLHFKGPGTDLKVGLSRKALFKGGSQKSANGTLFEANIPTEECFTTPDKRKTEGKVRITRPVFVNGKLVKGLELEFSHGAITKFTAKEGQDHFASYIENDEGAKYLGEVALVGIDSPIYQSKRIFHEILYDENAACHIAIGFAYRFCVDGGATMTAEELEQIGCNDSHVHTDFMISSEEVDVIAETFNGKEVPVITRGEWAI